MLLLLVWGPHCNKHHIRKKITNSCSCPIWAIDMFTHNYFLYQRKQTHRNPHAETHRVCAHQFLQLHANIQIHVSVSYITQQHIPSHTYRSMSRKSRTHKCKPTPMQICAAAPVIAHEATRTPPNYSHIHVPRDKITCTRRHRQVCSWKLSHRAPPPCTVHPSPSVILPVQQTWQTWSHNIINEFWEKGKACSNYGSG